MHEQLLDPLCNLFTTVTGLLYRDYDFCQSKALLFRHYRFAKSLNCLKGLLTNEDLVHKNEVDAGTFHHNFWIVVQLEIRDYLADQTFAVFQSVPGAMVSLHNTSVASHVNIELWLGIDVLLNSIFVGTNELIFKTQKSQQHARQIV